MDYIGCNSEVKKGDNIRLSGEDVKKAKKYCHLVL